MNFPACAEVVHPWNEGPLGVAGASGPDQGYVVVLAETARRRFDRRLGWALAVSLVVHVCGAILVAAGHSTSALGLIPPQPGRASLALAAVQQASGGDNEPMRSRLISAVAELTPEPPGERLDRPVVPIRFERLPLAEPPAPSPTANEAAATLVPRRAADPRATTEPAVAWLPGVWRGRTRQPVVEELRAGQPVPAAGPGALQARSRVPASQASEASAGAEVDWPMRAVFNPAPEYPPGALAARVTGRVVLRVRVANEGHVLSATVHITSGFAVLDEAALAAVRRWRFEPAPSDRAGTVRVLSMPFRFLIDEG